jgi:hypothetical protein
MAGPRDSLTCLVKRTFQVLSVIRGRKRRRKIGVPDETLDVAAALSTSRQASSDSVHHRRRWMVGTSRRWHRPTKSRVDWDYNVRSGTSRGR